MMKRSKKNAPVEPPDGGWGWIVVIGSTIILQLVLITRSIGVFLIEWREDFGASAAEVGAVGSIHLASFLFIGPLGGYLCRRYGSRPLAILSGFISCVGMVIASQSKTLTQIIFSFGVFTGIGCGFGYISAICIISKYFKKRFAIANSISSAGSGLAIIVFPVLARCFIDLYSWNGAMLVFAAFVANICAMGMLYRPVRSTSRKRENQHVVDCNEQSCQLGSLTGGEGTHLQVANEQKSVFDDDDDGGGDGKRYSKISTCSSRRDGTEREDVNPEEKTASRASIPISNEHRSNVVTYEPLTDTVNSKSKQRRPTKSSVHLKTFLQSFIKTSGIHLIKTHYRFDLICLVQITNGIGYSSVMVHFVSYAVYAGISKLDAAFLLSIIGIGSLAGRLLSGPIVDFKIISVVKLYAIVVFVSGLSIMLCPLISSMGGLCTVAATFGTATGAYKALNNVLIRTFLGAEHMTTGIGLFMPFMGLGALIGPISVGWLYDVRGQYDLALYMSGFIMMLGGFSLLLMPYLKKIERKVQKVDIDDADAPMGSVVSIPGT